MPHNLKRSRLQSEIDDNLKRAFDEVVSQDVPDRFLTLLNQLRSQEDGNAAVNAAPAKESNDDHA